MRPSSLIMLAVALVFGVSAAFLAKFWLENQVPEPQIVDAQPAVNMGTVVVATGPLRFGTKMKQAHLREVQWPQGAIPEGAFAKISDLLKGDGKRVILSAIEENEPVLGWKITGPGQRASLSALIDKNKKAVAIRVNDVQGVAGFVLPGERVDVLLTRTKVQEQGEMSRPKSAFTDVLLENVRVLAVDQLADDRTEKPSVVKTVTIEVATDQAQKLALAGSVGVLSLALRSAGSLGDGSSRRISLIDLGKRAAAATQKSGPTAVVVVTRAGARAEYNVVRFGSTVR
ncbi:MAG: Flp pilus assembly protein CpaB [Methyloligellaceae bacterium]